MWDELFYNLNNKITNNLINSSPNIAFKLMHDELNKVYNECLKVIKDDGIICINIGDATRTINKMFRLFPNDVMTINFFLSKGFELLPRIIWHKPTNSPNKFMGSGMLPVGAYNTLEHEHILIFRKNKRFFKTDEDMEKRRKSAFFQHERNMWCQDTWNVLGTKQKNNNKSRERNAAFPIEIPYRLIALNSIIGDTILDPFGGTGTTTIAAIALGRNSHLIEISPEFKSNITDRIENSKKIINDINYRRVNEAKKKNLDRKNKNKEIKYFNVFFNINVVTNQEKKIMIPIVKNIVINDKNIEVEYL